MMKRIQLSLLILLLFTASVFANQDGNDTFGHMWTDSKAPAPTVPLEWIDIFDGNDILSGQIDQVVGPISLPFDFQFYGNTYSNIYISSNGFISFNNILGSPYPTNGTLPASGPATMIAPFWDHLEISGTRSVWYKEIGVAPNRKFVIMWDFPYTLDAYPKRISFEIILYEENNLIKFQYYNSTNSQQGESATVGIKSGTDAIQYSYNQSASITPYSAILFHPDNEGLGSDGASALISPTSVQASTALRQFSYRINSIFPSQTTGLGKIDRIAVSNPFTGTTPTVLGIYINGEQLFIQNSTTVPSQREFATWHYQSDSLIIQTANFEVVDSIRIGFVQVLPDSTDSGDYTSRINARLDRISNQDASAGPSWTVEVLPATAHHFVKLAGDGAVVVGNTRQLQVRLEDEFNNPVNGASVTFNRTSGG
ncbi:MAG: hypothetical protein JSW33_07875, partial [bacterium]